MRKLLDLLMFVAVMALILHGAGLIFDWMVREASTDQNDIKIDDKLRKATEDTTWFSRFMKEIGG